MSQNSEREFSFTWRVENFSMCPMQEDEYLKSPIFRVDIWKKRKLQLWLYPRGWKTREWISCYAISTESEKEMENTTIGYSFTIAGSGVSNRTTVKSQYTLEKKRIWGISLGLLKKKEGVLPNDALTIQYRMWIINEETRSTLFTPEDLYIGKEGVLPVEILMSAARHELEEFKRHLCSTQCSAETRIRVGRKSLVWPIKRVQALRSDHRISLPVTSALVDYHPSFVMTFYVTGESPDRSPILEIRRKKSDYDKHLFVKCKITVLSSTSDVELCSEGEYFFKANMKDSVWNFPFSIDGKEPQAFLDSTNVIYLRCEFAYSRQGEQYHTGHDDSVPLRIATTRNIDSSFTLGNELKDTYKTGLLSDVTLRVGERFYKVHKTILGSRSPVFCAMFENDMKEKATGFVDIIDLDPDILDRMLFFLYSDQLDDLGPQDAVNLYSAADKYQVMLLKLRCSLHLQSILSVSNVGLILNLAHLHQDDNLLEVAKEFVFRNSNEILFSAEWKTLMENNLKLSASVMHQMLTR